jgi:hypothetical protein
MEGLRPGARWKDTDPRTAQFNWPYGNAPRTAGRHVGHLGDTWFSITLESSKSGGFAHWTIDLEIPKDNPTYKATTAGLGGMKEARNESACDTVP